MLRKTITYKDLDGNPVTEDFYFNLTKAEIAEMELSEAGGFSEYLTRIVREANENPRVVIDTFKEILTKAYGRRSVDNKRFIKSKEISDEFMQTDAYSELFMQLVTDAEASATFIRGIVPVDLVEEMTEKLNGQASETREIQDTPLPAVVQVEKDPLEGLSDEAIEDLRRRLTAKD